jgi:hypothetical protein
MAFSASHYPTIVFCLIFYPSDSHFLFESCDEEIFCVFEKCLSFVSFNGEQHNVRDVNVPANTQTCLNDASFQFISP